MALAGFPILSVLIFFPATIAALLALLPSARAARILALVAAALELAGSLVLLGGFDFELGHMQFVDRAPWIQSLSIAYIVGLDGLSVLFPALTALLTLGVILGSWTSIQSQIRLYLALVLLLESATLGVFCALDLALFFLFWELTLIPVFFLTSLWGIGPQRRHAAVKYVLFMLVGGVPLLFGIVLLGLNHAEVSELGLPQGLSFDYLTLVHTPLAPEVRTVVFFLLFLGFAVKAPVVPLHTWLPTMAMEGPIGLTALLTGLKLGLYGMLRFAFPLAPGAATEYAWLLALLGGIGAVYGALVALRQTNLRRMLAFSSISHAGFILAGLAALNEQGLQGALFQLANLAVVSGGLFLTAGFLHHRMGSTELCHMGGTARSMPLLSSLFLILGLAAIGVPGTSGFAAEHLILLGAFRTHPGVAVAGLLAVILGAAYFLGFYRQAFFGPLRGESARVAGDLRTRELSIAVVMAVLVLAGGMVPDRLLDSSRAAAATWVRRIHGTSESSAYAKLTQPGEAGFSR